MSEPANLEHSFLLADGRRIVFRPLVPSDEALIAEAIRTASPETLLHRFFIPLRGVAPEELHRMLILDPAREFCLVGELHEPPAHRIICGARYVRSPDPATAEIALTVHDDFQRQGIGRRLLGLLVEKGRQDGLRTFVADVMIENTAMLHLLRRVASRRRSTFSGGVCHVEFDLADVAIG
jgi:acetyltransferase